MKKLLAKLGIAVGRKPITEEQGIQKEWYAEAKIMTLKKLPKFLKKLADGYRHDYGTICHAVAAGAVAAGNAMNKSRQGGITGFQASAVMWCFIEAWTGDKAPAKLVKYEKMLYPQYAKSFEKIIDKSVWEWLQEQAKEHLKDVEGAHEKVIAHWTRIAEGNVPFGYVVEKQ